MSAKSFIICYALLVTSSQAFLSTSSNHLSPSPPTTTLKSSNDLFDTANWGAIREELDQVPIFAVANAEGQPLKYSIELAKKNDDGDNTYEVPLFYTHVEDALKELENAKNNNPLPGMDM